MTEKFTIDFLTGSSNHHHQQQPANMAQILYAGHDGVMSRDGSNYLNNSLHLDDVYSVISRDFPLTSSNANDNAGQKHTISNSYSDHYTGMSNCVSTTTSPVSPSDITRDSACSPVDVMTNVCDANERGTPSPNRDSGIESDHSPVSNQDSVEKTLKSLNEKAGKLTQKTTNNNKKSTTASKSSKDKNDDSKPGASYIALIAHAILSSPEERMCLGDIYRHISENHAYYDNEERAWRNSIRYNLSINECFVKAGREETGKGNYWAVHPQCLDDFKKGDFRRRQARRRARRNLKSLQDAIPKKTAPPNVSTYVPMTSLYPEYQPYPGMLNDRQTQQTPMLTANRLAPNMGQYFNPAQGYPAQHYAQMSSLYYSYLHQQQIAMSRNNASEVGYSLQAHSVPEVRRSTGYDATESNWYDLPAQQAVGEENTIVISQ